MSERYSQPLGNTQVKGVKFYFISLDMSNESISHVILNILEQVQTTTISIGSTEGHFLSQKQFSVLQDCAQKLAGSALPARTSTPDSGSSSASDDTERTIQTQELAISRALSIKQLQLSTASPEDKPALNLEISELLTRRAELDRLVKQLNRDL